MNLQVKKGANRIGTPKIHEILSEKFEKKIIYTARGSNPAQATTQCGFYINKKYKQK